MEKGLKVVNVGDVITIEEQDFKIRKITNKDLVLRPIKTEEVKPRTWLSKAGK